MSGMGTAPLIRPVLIATTAEALHERAAYLVDHLDTIRMSHEVNPGDFRRLTLSVVFQRNPQKALREAFRLLLGAAPPSREPEADQAAGEG